MPASASSGCSGPLTGLFLSNENTIQQEIDMLALVHRQASGHRMLKIIVEGRIGLKDCRSTK